jgi:hypothetical protein
MTSKIATSVEKNLSPVWYVWIVEREDSWEGADRVAHRVRALAATPMAVNRCAGPALWFTMERFRVGKVPAPAVRGGGSAGLM